MEKEDKEEKEEEIVEDEEGLWDGGGWRWGDGGWATKPWDKDSLVEEGEAGSVGL